MAGNGPAPKLPGDRRGRRPLARGEWKTSALGGWPHGPIPAAPEGLLPTSVAAWQAWFTSWWAAHWGPWDVPGLRCVVHLYDAIDRGDFARAGEYRLWADTYGITPKGRGDRRWLPPVVEAPEATTADRYRHLRPKQAEAIGVYARTELGPRIRGGWLREPSGKRP
jgi:hypothetical protein